MPRNRNNPRGPNTRARGLRLLEHYVDDAVPAPRVTRAQERNENERVSAMTKECPHCSAKLFVDESDKFCCNAGIVNLEPHPQLPENLQNLYLSNEAFRNNIRKYNQLFAFTSMGADVDQRMANGNNGVYTFRVNGVLSHRIGSLLPAPGAEPQFAQIYFMDPDMQVGRRMNIIDGLNQATMQNLHTMMQTVNNPLVRTFRQARELNANASFSVRIFDRVQGIDQRRYNAPTAAEVAAVFIEGEGAEQRQRDIVLFKNDGQLQRINQLHPMYDALAYPLFFPHGGYGWNVELRHSDDQTKKLTLLEYQKFHLQVRDQISPILLGGRLLQQYICDQFCRIEDSRLSFIRSHQDQLRAHLYTGLADAINDGSDLHIGRRVVLPSSFVGSPRYMQQKYQDAMAMVRKFGKPDLFITMTCNPKWPEIQNELLPFQKAEDRPDIVARVFQIKLDELIHQLVNRYPI